MIIVWIDHPDNINIPNNNFVDEDMIFDMPNILVNMAHGMLLSPPRMNVDSDFDTDYSGDTLWNYP